jgi:hypothetical protein
MCLLDRAIAAEDNCSMQTATDEARRTQAKVQMRRLRKAVCSLTLAFFGFAPAGWSQTADSDSANANKSWKGTTESQDSALGSRMRSVESHTQNGNRTVDKQSVEVLRSGSYEPYQDIERESVKVNDTTTRSVVRTFGRDANGERTLIQVTEEEKQTLPGGGAKVVRSTLNPDSNGNTQVVQREVQETKKVSPNVEETTTTVSLPGANGGLATAMKVEERQERSDDHTVQFRKSTLLPDGAGNWGVGEVRKGTITEEGKNRTKDEHISRPGPDGQMVEVQHTVGRESESAAGEKRSTVESYAADVPGTSPDGGLHLVQRVTTASRAASSGGQTTQQQVEQINPGDPGASLQVTVLSTDTQKSGTSGTQESRTIQVRGANGSLEAVSVDMTKSDKTPAVKVQIAPTEKPK